MNINSVKNHITFSFFESLNFKKIKPEIFKELSSIDRLNAFLYELKHNWSILELDSRSISNSTNHNLLAYSNGEINKIIIELKKIHHIDSIIRQLAKKIIKEYDLHPPTRENEEIILTNIEDNKIYLTENRILLFIDHNQYSISKAILKLNKLLTIKTENNLKERIIEHINETKVHLRQVFIQSQAIIELKKVLDDRSTGNLK